MRRALALVALLAAATLLAPVAGAEHVYSHRFVFEGRLVGADGLPLPGRTVEFFHQGGDDEGAFGEPCADSPHQDVTDEFGDFRFCFHEHALDTRTTVGVRVGNVTQTKPIDTAFRRSIVLLRDREQMGVAPEAWNRTYRVAGKAWQAGLGELEGVRVFGTAVPDLPVNVTIETADGDTTTLQTVTDAYGDFDLVVETEEDPGSLRVTLEAAGRQQPVRLDPVFHRTTTPLFVAPEESPTTMRDPIQTNFQSETRGRTPGSTTPPVSPVLIGTMGLLLVGAIWLARRSGR